MRALSHAASGRLLWILSDGGRAPAWEKVIDGLAASTVVDYWFTYEKSGPLYDTPDWKNAAKYYLTAPRNDYGVLPQHQHRQAVHAFAYDDVNDQSSVKILGNSNPPSRLTLTIGW